eukprot:COSAG02_NODE_287_length_25647_cov_245.259316_23_plen_369_part_00
MLMKSGAGKLSYDPAMSISSIPKWRSDVRTKLLELMCFPLDNSYSPPLKQRWVQPRDGYRLEKWEAYPEHGSVVPFLVLIPDGCTARTPAPAVMCFPGSVSSKELLAGEPELRPSEPPSRHPTRNTMALQYVQAGLVAVVAENPGIGELDEVPGGSPDNVNSGRDKLSAELMMLGRHYVGLSVFQKLHILDWLCEQRWVDRDRIAVSGHSLGTEPALCMMVLDERIKAMVFNDYLTHNRIRYAVRAKDEGRWVHSNPLWHIIPGLLQWFDFPDLLAACAPRPLIICEGGPRALLEAIGRAYQNAGARDCYEYHFYPKFAQVADRWSDEIWPPADGITEDEWLTFANVDVPEHCFKGELAVPWLLRVLS